MVQHDDPFDGLDEWLEHAVRSGIGEPHAMTLATVDPRGWPAARMVLLKGFDTDGLLFSTNYESRKARELEQNPRASLVFFWQPLHRQIRVEGSVERATDEESDRIYAARPRGSQLAAWASAQSRPLADREALEVEFRRHEERFSGVVPRPPFWGAYRLHPDRFEFWAGRRDRLHDRLCYTRTPGAGWQVERLAP